MLKLISLLAQFDKNPVAALGMHERDEFVVSPDPGLLAEQLKAFLFQTCHLAVNVRNRKSDMMNAFAFLRDEFCDRTRFIRGFKQFYFIRPNLEKRSFYTLAQNLLYFVMWLVKKRFKNFV